MSTLFNHENFSEAHTFPELSWSKIYSQSSTEAKKMILSKLIERVEAGRD